mmetsp:Transcript_2342/g.3735  ORF Transcript_2342/g.3735 Transcript_2342/m.3735 type:complete len:374 (-) Transcript_2342:518-1639(-)
MQSKHKHLPPIVIEVLRLLRPFSTRVLAAHLPTTVLIELFELYHLLEHVEEDALGRPLGLRQLGHHAQHLPRGAHVVLQVLLAAAAAAAGAALVGQLRQPHALRGEVLVQVELVQRRRRRLLQRGREDGRLQRGQRALELRRDQAQGLVLHVQPPVEGHRLGDQVRVELEQPVVEQQREVLREHLRVLQAALEPVGHGLGAGRPLVLGQVVLPLRLQPHAALVQQPPQQHLHQRLVLLLVQPLVGEDLHRGDHHQPPAARVVLVLVAPAVLGFPGGRHRPVQREGDGPAAEQGPRRRLRAHRGAVGEHEREPAAVRSVHLFVRGPHQAGQPLLADGHLARERPQLAPRRAHCVFLLGYLWVQNAIGNEDFLGM